MHPVDTPGHVTDAEERAAGALAELFPPFVQFGLSSTWSRSGSPHAEERAAVTGASARRQAEFLSGRACAHAALSSLGRSYDAAIGAGPAGEPLWPPGVVGTISHGGDWCAAAVTTADQARGLGLDIERLQPLSREVQGLVLTGPELGRLPSCHPLSNQAGLIAFSCKEAVYKCLFPLTGQKPDFHDIAVEVDLDSQSYSADLVGRHGPGDPDAGRLQGLFRLVDGHVLTALCLI